MLVNLNQTVARLESFKDALIEAVNYYWHLEDADAYEPYALSKILSAEEYKTNRHMLLLFYMKYNQRIPDLFEKNRELIDLLNYLFDEIQLESEAIKEIKEELYPVMDALEIKNMKLEVIYVQPELPEILTHSHILTEVRKGEQRIDQGDYAGAITSSKTLVESVIKELLIKFEPENKEKIDNYDLLKLYKNLRKHLNMDKVDTKSGVENEENLAAKKFEESLNRILSGFNNVIQGLAEIRNLSGDSHLPTVKASRHHAVMAVNSSITICNFLFHTYKYQQEAKQKVR